MLRVLLVNPSFGSEPERNFWKLLAQASDEGMAEVHAFTMRPAKHPQQFHAEIHAACLSTYGNGEAPPTLDRLRIPKPPDWLTPATTELQIDWEQRRWGGNQDPLAILRGLNRLACVAEHTIGRVEPDLVLTTNKIDHPCAVFRKAAITYGVSTALVERSPFAGIWMEPDGLFAESQIAPAWSAARIRPDHEQMGAELLEYLRVVPATFRANQDRERFSELAKHDRSAPEILLLMDNVLWTGWAQRDHPQRPIDYPYLSESPQQAIERIAGECVERGFSLRVRAHPSCVEHLTWRLPAGAIRSAQDLASDLELAHGVIAFNTKVSFAAAAMHKPLATLAPNPIEPSGVSHVVRTDSQLADFLKSVGHQDEAPKDSLAAYAGWLADDYMFGEKMASTPAQAHDLIDRLALLSRSVGANQPDDANRHAPIAPIAPVVESNPTRRPLNVIEMSRLQSTSLRHSGIAVAQRQLALALSNEPEHDSLFLLDTDAGPPKLDVDVAGIIDLVRSTEGRVVPVTSEQRQRVLSTLTRHDVYHSTHRELPPADETGDALRILTVHDVIHEHRPELERLPNTPYISVILDTSTQVDLYICDSEQTRRDLIRCRPIDPFATTVIQLGVAPVEESGPDRFTENPYVLVVAQPSQRKNMARVAETLDLLAAQGSTPPSLEFVVAGSASAVELVRSALSMPASRRFRAAVEPSPALLAQLYRGAEVCLFASEFEGFGLIPLEAMAHSCPVVTPWNSSLAEVCQSAAEYSMTTEPSDLHDALIRVLKSPALAAQMRSEGLARAQSCSWERSALSHLDTYDALRRRREINS